MSQNFKLGVAIAVFLAIAALFVLDTASRSQEKNLVCQTETKADARRIWGYYC